MAVFHLSAFCPHSAVTTKLFTNIYGLQTINQRSKQIFRLGYIFTIGAFLHVGQESFNKFVESVDVVVNLGNVLLFKQTISLKDFEQINCTEVDVLANIVADTNAAVGSRLDRKVDLSVLLDKRNFFLFSKHDKRV